MVVIGITGGIGSGKSTVCSMFAERSVPIFFADRSAKVISETTAKQEIMDAFGIEIITPSNDLDRNKLAEIVFHDPKKLTLLNSIIHPKVFESFHHWRSGLPGETKYALAEAALMFESGMFQMMDYVLAVMANDDIRINRTVVRDKADAGAIAARMKNQISTEELLELSDFQINNNGSLTELRSKVNFFAMLFPTLTTPTESE